MTRALPLALLSLALVACGSSNEGTTSDEVGTSTTSGSEDPITDDAETAAADEPVVLRSTIPVPVPQPAVPREELSDELQAVWTAVEEQVADGRPDGPEEETVDNVQAWADGPFREWIDARRQSLTETRELLAAIAREPAWERGLALALWAYAFEDMGAQIAGAPVPREIAEDPELLGIYVTSLNDASVPLGRRAVELYADCRERLASLGDDSEWLPWRAYCVQRGQEVIEGYGLAADAAEDAPE